MTPSFVLSSIQAKNPNFKSRPGQLELIRLAYEILMKSSSRDECEQMGESILVADAPTGVGKSLGYLIPALCVREKKGVQVVISSATISLQEQILKGDIPFLEEALGRKLSVAIAKGRSRFLCPLKLDEVTTPVTIDLFGDVQNAPNHSKDEKSEAQLLAERFARGTWSGDRDELESNPSERVWASISTDSSGCLGKHCRHVSDCPYMKAKARFAKADFIIANHALVLADMKIGFSILPKPETALYIFDEAHNLPRMAVGSMATSHPIIHARKWIDRVLRVAERLIKVSGIKSVDIPSIRKSLNELSESLKILEEYAFSLPEFKKGRNVGDQLPTVTVEGDVPDILHGVGTLIYDRSSALASDLAKVTSACSDLVRDSQEIAKNAAELGSYVGRLSEMEEVWGLILAEVGPRHAPIARWFELKMYGRDYDITVNASPVSAAEKLKARFWSKVQGCVLVSATLAVVGGFRSFLKRTGLAKYEAVTAVKLTSPFDYERNGKLVLYDSGVDPRDHAAHTSEIARILPTIIDCMNGEGTLCLFSSRKQMEEVFEALPASMKKITHVQGRQGRAEVIKRHTAMVSKGQSSVIMGLASFGEGIDLKGKLLTHVIIAKIPFDPPTSPVEKVTAAWLKDLGADPFLTLVVPEASVKLIQNVGRLLRTETDSGVVSILDRRLGATRYGNLILNALPPFTVEKRIFK
jgi:ATP-dependent DNA helicase DinG